MKLLENMMGAMIGIEVDHHAFAIGGRADSLHDRRVGRAALDQLDPGMLAHTVVDHGEVDVHRDHQTVDAHHLLHRGEEQRAPANVDPGLDDQLGPRLGDDLLQHDHVGGRLDQGHAKPRGSRERLLLEIVEDGRELP